MRRWGRTERKDIPRIWDAFDDVNVPSTSSAVLDDDLLGEIDGLLRERDFLIGFWQAPGE